MERNILRTVALALMLMALCPVTSEVDSNPSNSDGMTISTTPTEDPMKPLTPSEETQSTTATSTPRNSQITSSAESSPTATPSEPAMKSHVTEVSTPSTEGSRKSSTSSEETEKSTAISPSGTPPITSPTESSTSATTLEHTMKSHVTEISTEFTEGSRKTSTSTEETKRSTAISPPGTPPITESYATAITFEGTTKSHVTEILTASTEGSRESSTSSGENENTTATSPPGSLVTKEETPTPSPPTTSTSPKPTTPKPPAVQTFTITYHIEETFTEELSDKSSAAYKALEEKIRNMYQEVYNCSTCPNAGQYVGFTVNSFRNGSVVADTTLHFKESAKVSKDELHKALSDASEAQRQGLKLTKIEVTKEETPTPSPPTTSTSPKPTTPKPPAVQTFTITYHIEKTFTEELSDKSSAAYKELEDKIGKMYQEVYNCSTCPNAGQYVGFTVNSFRNGSVVADTTLHFKESAKVSKDELHKALSDASEAQRQGLKLTKIEVTSDTTEPSTSPPSTTTSTTLPSLMYFSLSYHIEMDFSEDLLNPSSSAYKDLNMKIEKMYEEVYNCLGCPTAGRYYGYTVNSFRPGSIVADTTLWFVGGKPISSEELRTALSEASPEQRQYLNLANIEARNFGSDTPSHPETVPGWGIALLVLVCILLLLALIAFLIQIIHWCRRNHRGKLDLLSNQDSYHIMSEYPTYHTHGRYVAPGSKPNPYSETLPKNGNAPFSYTNPTMANDEL